MIARVSFKSMLRVLLMSLILTVFAPGVLSGTDLVYGEEKPGGKRPTVLLILDGYGLSEQSEHNAIALADTPVMDRLMKEYPFVEGNASGEAVGLPEGQMGSSEVGHLNMGAGRIVYQDLVRITKAIEDGSFFENEALLKAMNDAKEKGTSLHLYGLVSDGGVHSHNTHLYALLEMAKRQGLEKVYVHCFLDGRDTPPESGKDYVQALQDEMDRIGCGRIATVAGRYYAMDRDKHWDRIEKAYRALTLGEGVTADSALEAVTQSYEKGETDEFVQPTVVMEDGAPVATINDGDSIIFFNFRPDRARELTRVFCCDEFDGFDRGPRKQVTYACFTDYDETIPNKEVAFKKETITNTFGEWLASKGLKQARIAETEKYAHVTIFFNGGVETLNEGEDRFLIPSPDVATYDLKPEMSAQEVCDTLIEKIRSDEYDVIIANFANSDMVGHTGVEKAAIEAVSFLDKCIGRVVETIEEVDGQLFICADHGNAEVMEDPETGEPWTAHTTNPVPFILVNYDPAYTLREGGCLADIAPTLIEMMGMEKPEEMTGESLLIKKTSAPVSDGEQNPAMSADTAAMPAETKNSASGRPEDNPEVMLPLHQYELKGSVEVNGRQGVCSEGEYYWVSGSTTLSKYDRDWNLIATNEDPFKGYTLEVNHIADIDVYNQELYIGAEYFMDGVGKNIQIAVYDSDTLELKRTFPFASDSGQLECSGIAVDPDTKTVWMCSWVGEESGRYLYKYDLETGEYLGKVHLQMPPQWLQGIAYYDGWFYMTADDGTADDGEPDHLYRTRIEDGASSCIVTLERTFDDVTMQGEIEGLTFDRERRELLLLYNRGARIVLGMPKGFYDNYDREISEVFTYQLTD